MRVALSVVLLVLALGGAGALAAWGMQRDEGASGAYRVEAVGPSGVVLDATVDVEAATALMALEEAARAAGVALDLVDYPGMGTYVRAIGGFEASGASGWVYGVVRNGERLNGDRSAEHFALQKGDSVRWDWTAG